MKYRSAQYAAALFGAMSGKKEIEKRAIARRLPEILSRHRMLGKFPAILAAYEKLILRARGERKVRIESAARISEEVKKQIGDILGVKIYFEEKEVPGLFAGIRILIDDELLIDASVERQIRGMFSASKNF